RPYRITHHPPPPWNGGIQTPERCFQSLRQVLGSVPGEDRHPQDAALEQARCGSQPPSVENRAPRLEELRLCHHQAQNGRLIRREVQKFSAPEFFPESMGQAPSTSPRCRQVIQPAMEGAK